MSDHHSADVVVRIAAFPLLGALGAIAAVRDSAARARARGEDTTSELALSWNRLNASQRARLLGGVDRDPSPL